MKNLMTITSILFSMNVWAIGEANYAQEYQQKIIPVLQKFQHGTFKGQKNLSIHYATYTTNPSAHRCLIVLPGRSEPLEKYAEVVHDLDTGALAGEFQYFLMDHRGQGSSGRMIRKESADSQKGHVDEFANYTLDLKEFLDTVVASRVCSEKLLLAHSLGAGISVDLMQKFPEYIDRAALSSPMLKIQTAPYKYELAKAIVVGSIAVGRKKKFAIGQHGFTGIRNFEKNTFTSSPARYEMAMNTFDMVPASRLGGVTNGWINEVMKGTKDIRENYDGLRIPLRVFHAGIESYSEKSEMIRLCDKAPYCNRTYLETSKHEVLMDRDVNRDIVIKELENFLK